MPYSPTADGLVTATAVAAVTVVVAAVAVVAVLTATAATVMPGLQLLGSGVTHELDISAVAHGLARQLVIEVHKHLVVGDLDHLALDAHAFLRHHGHTGTGANVLLVKLALDVENLLLQLINQVGILLAEGLMGLKGEIKLLTLLQTHDAVLETLDERQIHAKDKSIGMLLVELENTHAFFTVDNKDLIDELHIFSCLNFLH